MTGNIEGCLGVVLQALRDSKLPAHEVMTWCSEMLKSDGVKFIATEEIRSLRRQFQDAGAR